jgi:phosphohistidine swiveling domain-containing protein
VTDWPPHGPVNNPSASARWTTVNAEEAFPGVTAPLTWSFYGPCAVRVMIQLWKNLGTLPRSHSLEPTTNDESFVAAFCGRIAMNVDLYGRMADLMPGTSAQALEEQFFGVSRDASLSKSSARRYPIVALKAPVAVLNAHRQTIRQRPAFSAWRARSLDAAETASLAKALGLLRDAQRRLEPVLLRHILLTMITQAAFERVRNLAAGAGRPGAELDLVSSPDGTDESRLVEALWALSREESVTDAGMSSFLAEYGYHGPDEGHLNGRVWREDPTPVRELVDRYRRLDAAADPAAVARCRAQRSHRVRADLLAALPRTRRGAAKATLRLAGSMTQIREVGKSTFLQVVDVGRAAARVAGGHLARAGRLDAADDVFFLSFDEVAGAATVQFSEDLAERARNRRAEDAFYRSITLPSTWTGEPQPLHDETAAGAVPFGADLTGLGVSAGICEGTVRVMSDPVDGEFEPGDVLVCHLTDPSWAGAMVMAGGLVIDVGSAVSHGAIVARELGIPCVTNTRVGTSTLRHGSRVRVDGTAGTVTTLN